MLPPGGSPLPGPPSFFDFTTETLEGSPAQLAEYAGRVCLVVNVASRCGLTPQYTALEALHSEFAPRGFTVLGFPSNDFGGQEPGTPEEIRTFCSTRYAVSFPLFAKRKVKGRGKDEIYRFLTRDHPDPSWNFTKYLVGRDGQVITRFDPRLDPKDLKFRRAIESALEESGG
jgi:glutathione peroxidase